MGSASESTASGSGAASKLSALLAGQKATAQKAVSQKAASQSTADRNTASRFEANKVETVAILGVEPSTPDKSFPSEIADRASKVIVALAEATELTEAPEENLPQAILPARPFAELDAAEREALLLEHLPVVRYIARRIHERLPQHVEMEDLVSAGMVGLLDAFNKFDTGKNVQFRSYAQFRVRGAILDSLRTLDWSPRDLRRKGRAIEEAIHTLTSRMGRTPQEHEIAIEMGISLIEYQQLLGDLKGLEIGSLHVEHTEDSGEEELAYVPSNPEEDPLFRCLKGEMRDRLAAAIDDLPEKERLVLTLYYYEEMTMKEIGLTLNVVESRISQIHSSAVLHMRSKLAHGSKPKGTRIVEKKVAPQPLRRPAGRVSATIVHPVAAKPETKQRLW